MNDTITSKIALNPSNLETIDGAIYEFVKSLNLHCTTNKGFIPVPIVWTGAERSFQVKSNPSIKDLNGSLIFPILSIERTSIKKTTDSKGKFYANIPKENDYKGGSIVIASRIKEDKTQNFQDAEQAKLPINFPKKIKKTVYEFATMQQPVYIEVLYKVKIKTEYQQQINEIIQPFIVKPGSANRIMVTNENHRYEAYMQTDYAQTNNIDDFSDETRKFETEISIKVFGYLLGADVNDEYPTITIRENVVDLKISKEVVMVGKFPD